MLIVRISAITADAVRRALIKAGNLKTILSITTENDCEFLNSAQLFKGINADRKIDENHACAAREKGTVENVNRHIRHFYPKGTDFQRVSSRQVTALQTFINSIPHKTALRGKTANETFFAAS